MKRGPIIVVIGLLAGLSAYIAACMASSQAPAQSSPPSDFPPPPGTKTRLGINLYSVATYNRHQIFTNLIAQSEWFEGGGKDGWKVFPADQLDARGWIRFLKPGQTAPRPLTLPSAPFRTTTVRCTFEGRGVIGAGGAAGVRESGDKSLTLQLAVTGHKDEGAWLELTTTDPADPVRNIDCRETDRPAHERFHPAFMAFVKPFRIVRFLDWQRTNDNVPVQWSSRAKPDGSSQAGATGVSIEDMVDLANQAQADPWFLMPYRADAIYIEAFARLVRQRLDPSRTVYVELSNEVWNDNFDAARQAQREGLERGLGDGDPTKAQMARYAEKVMATMQIWTKVYADRPDRLVRVAAAHNAYPERAEMVLGHGETARWVDVLATAPYVWLNLDNYRSGDSDKVFAQVPAAIDQAYRDAERNRAIAARYSKLFIAYEGGQHLIAKDEALNLQIQRDPRMGDLYRAYLARWDRTIHSDLVLYASVAPIGEYGSWGLLEYGGQPVAQAPKLLAVRRFLESQR